MQEFDLDAVAGSDFYVFEGLDSEGAIAGYLLEAQTEGAAGIIDALADVAVARFINQVVDATGVDRRQLCAAFEDSLVLDEETLAKVLQFAGAPMAVV